MLTKHTHSSVPLARPYRTCIWPACCDKYFSQPCLDCQDFAIRTSRESTSILLGLHIWYTASAVSKKGWPIILSSTPNECIWQCQLTILCRCPIDCVKETFCGVMLMCFSSLLVVGFMVEFQCAEAEGLYSILYHNVSASVTSDLASNVH